MTPRLASIRSANEAYARACAGRPVLPARPSLGLVVLTCMDCRINVHEALGLADGQAHILRNAGGLATDDVLRSLVVSQWALGTEEVLVIQHTTCGMLGLDEPSLRAQIAQETGAAPPWPLAGFEDLEASVHDSVERIRACQSLRARDRVSGFIFDLETRQLRQVT